MLDLALVSATDTRHVYSNPPFRISESGSPAVLVYSSFLVLVLYKDARDCIASRPVYVYHHSTL